MNKLNMVTYKAKGVVIGYTWGGGLAGYASENIVTSTLKNTKSEIKRRIEDGTLDSGFGFETVIGAIMKITRIKTIQMNDGLYTNTRDSIHFFGKVPKDFRSIAKEL